MLKNIGFIFGVLFSTCSISQFHLENYVGEHPDKIIIYYAEHFYREQPDYTVTKTQDQNPIVITVNYLETSNSFIPCENDTCRIELSVFSSANKMIRDDYYMFIDSIKLEMSDDRDLIQVFNKILNRSNQLKWIQTGSETYCTKRTKKAYKDKSTSLVTFLRISIKANQLILQTIRIPKGEKKTYLNRLKLSHKEYFNFLK